MKTSFLILAFFLSAFTHAQDFPLRKHVDSIVRSIADKPGKMLSFNRTLNNKTSLKYRFFYTNANLHYIERHASNSDSLVIQIFYIKNSLPIFASESVTHYYGKDSIGSGGTYYFSDGKLKDFWTHGHGKEDGEWDLESGVMGNFKKAKADIDKYYRKKK
jgi:hypothetical protein